MTGAQTHSSLCGPKRSARLTGPGTEESGSDKPCVCVCVSERVMRERDRETKECSLLCMRLSVCAWMRRRDRAQRRVTEVAACLCYIRSVQSQSRYINWSLFLLSSFLNTTTNAAVTDSIIWFALIAVILSQTLSSAESYPNLKPSFQSEI